MHKGNCKPWYGSQGHWEIGWILSGTYRILHQNWLPVCPIWYYISDGHKGALVKEWPWWSKISTVRPILNAAFSDVSSGTKRPCLSPKSQASLILEIPLDSQVVHLATREKLERQALLWESPLYFKLQRHIGDLYWDFLKTRFGELGRENLRSKTKRKKSRKMGPETSHTEYSLKGNASL